MRPDVVAVDCRMYMCIPALGMWSQPWILMLSTLFGHDGKNPKIPLILLWWQVVADARDLHHALHAASGQLPTADRAGRELPDPARPVPKPRPGTHRVPIQSSEGHLGDVEASHSQ